MDQRRKFIARDYQAKSIDFILETKRATLMADLGTGKTVSGLTAYDMLLATGHETKPMLVLGPLRVARKVWSTEAAKWDHLSNIEVSPIVGTPDERRSALRRSASVFTINYENLPWLVEELDGKWPFGFIMPDESTRLAGLRVSIRTSSTGKTWAQGQGTLRARRLAKVVWKHRYNRWLNLSGTPAPNGLKKFWGQNWFVDFGERLGTTYTAFEQRYFKKGFDGYNLEPLPGSDKLIHEKLKDVCCAILAKDYLKLDEPINVPVYIELPSKARALYREMEKKFYLKFGTREVEAVHAGSKANKLLQLASGAIYLDPEAEGDDDPRAKEWVEIHDEKILALESIIEESGGMPLIVAYQFKSDRARLQKAFPKMRFLETQRDEDDFKAPPPPKKM